MPDDIPRDFRKHAKRAEKQGWRFRKTKSGYLLLAPDGIHSVTIHKTPSSTGIRNYLAEMRRYGYRSW